MTALRKRPVAEQRELAPPVRMTKRNFTGLQAEILRLHHVIELLKERNRDLSAQRDTLLVSCAQYRDRVRELEQRLAEARRSA